MEPRMDPDVEVDAVSNGENDQQHLDDWLKTAGEDATRWVQEHRPSVAEAELDDRLPRAPSQFDETYTADDEAKLQYDWQQDLLRPHILNHGDNSVMTRLWKMTQRLWPGTYPGVLISRANMLEYDPDPNVHHITVNKTRVKNPYWSKVFCQGLETLLVHPLWDGDVANMIIFIQYAVICRTNDQRGSQWPRENPTRDLSFETFRQHTANIHHDMESVVDLHQRALRGLGNVPIKASKLLLAIEAAAFDAVTEPFLPSEPTAPYKVCTKDLQVILTALQNLTVNGVPMYLPPSTYLDMISKAIRKSQTSPSDAKLEEYRDRVLLDMRRTEKRNDNVLRINRNMQDPADELLIPGAATTGSRPSPSNPPFGERLEMDIPNLPEFACERGFEDPVRRFKFQSIKFTRFAPSMLLHHAVHETVETHVLLDPNHSGLEVPKV